MELLSADGMNRSLFSSSRSESRRQDRTRALATLVAQLSSLPSREERAALLLNRPEVVNFLASSHPAALLFQALSLSHRMHLASLVVLEQAEALLADLHLVNEPLRALQALCESLETVEIFYADLGGVVGYHLQILRLQASEGAVAAPVRRYLRPQGVDVTADTQLVRQSVLWGIEQMGQMCEIYPVGGAADRLSLMDERTGNALPAAKLVFCGKTLLQGMIGDLQAREYLHYKLTGRQLMTPVAMMTSQTKHNHEQIVALCEEEGWFGRPRETFYFFSQPSVPTINRDGKWCLQSSMKLLMKPGGHGVMWRLAHENGVFAWLASQGRRKALVRQINNPLASTDHGLLALTGLGCAHDKIFGFASCPRQVKASEGINVLIETELGEEYEYVLTNIEYCDFAKNGIQDEPEEPGSSYSKFPSNTNILFADLAAVERAALTRPIPGMLVNCKKASVYREGLCIQEEVGRLESTMQNIADCFATRSSLPLDEEEQRELGTFLTYNQRRKTISTTKRAMTLGSSLLETPEGCFLDALENAYDLLSEVCGLQLPDWSRWPDMIERGPPFLCLLHPALGPLYSVIGQKIRGGSMTRGSELHLELVDLDWEQVAVDGSLVIFAEQALGHVDETGILRYSNETGKCTLRRVEISNAGIDREAPNVFWKDEVYRQASCTIVLHGNGEFVAEDVLLEGNLLIEVPAGTRLTVRQEAGQLVWVTEPLAQPSWEWLYTVDSDLQIRLTKTETPSILVGREVDQARCQ